MKFIKAILSVAITLVLIWALQTKFGPMPPLGKFLNPATGFWQNAESKYLMQDPAHELKLYGLHDQVLVKYDDRRIPHIFARNNHDLYFAQGYLTAADRLWQMDIQTRSAAGRLAEVVGPAALEVDRYHRRMGMVYGAENTLRGMMRDPKTREVIEAYTEGINQYIGNLTIRNYPLEFKLLDYKPELWKPINCALLLKLMSETLAGGSDELELTNTLNTFGAAVTRELFPDRYYQEEPIIPAGTQWSFKPLPIPSPSRSFLAQMNNNHPHSKVEGIGSNNWALSGSRTANGYPLLANDPHLNLTLPSIWYQVQLQAPGVNVYGVSLPGAPNIIIGYNNHISWGVTNVDADVLDWYQIKFKDASKRAYWHNNRWNPTTRRTEVIKVRGQQPVTEQVIYTHHGPVVYENEATADPHGHKHVPVGTALRWIAHDESDELRTFYMLNRAKNYNDYRQALAHYSAPAQNFIFASRDNDIAITPNGKLPLKFKDQGKFILDGTDAANDWQGWIPNAQNPTVKNPARGFVSSGNQASTDGNYPYYINWQFGGYQRGKRINDLLASTHHATADSMRLMQTDNYSILAHDVLPALLQYIDTTKLDGTQLRALQILRSWNKRFDVDAQAAILFNRWWDEFYEHTWRDEFGRAGKSLKWPSRDETIHLLFTQPRSKWFDNTYTPATETCTDIASATFNNTVNALVHDYGQPGPAWQWGKVRPVAIAHLANIDGLGSASFASGGWGGAINAISNKAGPSWRMVVQLGPAVKGYGIFPGGESGNPGSFYYTDMLPAWQNGRLDELLFLQSAKQSSKRIRTTLTLNKK